MTKIYNNPFLTDGYRQNQLLKKGEQIQKGLSKGEAPQDEKLYKACQDFEAIFYQMIFKEMRKTVQKSEMVDGGFAEDVFEGMLDEEFANSAAKSEGKLADLLYQQLRLQLDSQNQG